ncbi:reverse transcriptase domain-containing protein [Tanacetum coccineum]
MVRVTRQNPTPESSPKPNPDIATIIAQHLESIIPQIITPVTTNVNNATGGNGNGGNDGYSYKTFTSCNPKEFDGKGGTVALTRWIENIKSVFDNSGCREAAIGMSWNDFRALLMEELCPSNEIEKLENEFWNLTMVGANHVAYTDRFHKLAKLVPHMVTPESSRIKRLEYSLTRLSVVGHWLREMISRKRWRNQIKKGTFSLNNQFATVLFNSGADFSFISTEFAPLLNVEPYTVNPG